MKLSRSYNSPKSSTGYGSRWIQEDVVRLPRQVLFNSLNALIHLVEVPAETTLLAGLRSDRPQRRARAARRLEWANWLFCTILSVEEPMARHTFHNRPGELVEIPEVAATQAKNPFGDLLDHVAASGAVAIPRHDVPKAVLLSYEEFESLSSMRSETLDALSTKFESLLQRMQTPAARKGMEAAFKATPAALGRAAVKAARRRR